MMSSHTDFAYTRIVVEGFRCEHSLILPTGRFMSGPFAVTEFGDQSVTLLHRPLSLTSCLCSFEYRQNVFSKMFEQSRIERLHPKA